MSYLDRLSRRTDAVKVDKGYQCLCCKDDAIISRFMVRQHLLTTLQGEVLEEYQELLVEGYDIQASNASVPILCTRPGCRANEVLVEKEGQRVKVDRYNPEYLISADPGHCQWLHEQELARYREDNPPAPQVVRQAIVSGGIGRSMEAAPVEVEQDLPDQVDGFSVGDRVVVDISRLSKSGQKEMMKGNGFPVGQSGTVIRLEFKQVVTKEIWLIVQLDSGKVEALRPMYLVHSEVAAA